MRLPKWALLLILAGVALFAVLIFWMLRRPTVIEPIASQVPPLAQDLSKAPRFREVTGTVLVLRGTDLFRAEPSIALQTGDLVQTGTTGTADILWPEYGHTLLASGTSLRITDILPGFTAKLGLEAGRIWTRLQKVLDVDDFFGVRVSNVSAVVRGTSFGLAREGQIVAVQVTESIVGVARVTSSDAYADPKDETPVTAGQELRVALGVDEPVGKPAPLSPKMGQDPFVLRGGQAVSEDELRATDGRAADLSGPATKISVIESSGRLIPLDQIHASRAEAGCKGEHYHANNGFVTALDGTIVPDPGGCAYGIVSERPSIVITRY